MSSVNKVILVGNLGKDPEARLMQNGSRVVNFSLATSEKWRDQSGEQKERTEWHRVVIFNDKLGELAEKYLHKGSKVYLEGAVQTRKYTDQSGVEKYTTEIVLGMYKSALVFLDTRDGGESHEGRGSSRPKEQAYSGRSSSDGWEGSSKPKAQDDIDDEIPF